MATTSLFRAIFTISAVDRASRVINDFVGNAASRFERLEKKVGAVSGKMRQVGAVAAGVGIAIALGLAAPTKQAIAFEQAMGGVAKQVAGIRDANGNLNPVAYKEMTDQVFRLSIALRKGTTETAAMVEAGARMGVPKAELASFTMLSGMMAEAFDVADPGPLTEKMGKLANVLQLPFKQLGGLADVINYLDDQTLAKGGDIIEVLSRIGGTSRQIGLTNNNAVALASTFLSLGSSAEVSSTAATALMRELAIATAQPERFAVGLKALGMNAKAVQSGMARDAQGTMLKVLDAINKLPKDRQIEITTRIFGKEYGDDVAKLAQNVTMYREQIQLANAMEAKGSMQREFNAKMKQTDSLLKLAQVSLQVLSIKFGSLFIPLLNRVLNVVNPMIQGLIDWVDQHPKLAKGFGLAAAGLAAFLLTAGGALLLLGTVGGAIASGFGLLSKVAGPLLSRLGPLATHIGALGVRVGGLAARFGALFNWGRSVVQLLAILTGTGVGLWVMGIVAVVAIAAALLFKYWRPIAGFFRGLWRGILEGAKPLGQTLAPVFNLIGRALAPVIGWLKQAFGWLVALLKPVDDVGGGAEKMGLRFGQAIGGAINAIAKFYVWIYSSAFKAGKTLVDMLVQGITGGIGKVKEAMGNLTAAARRYLPFSPSKDGAFRDLHKVRIVETIAESVKPAPLTKALAGVTAAAMVAAAPAKAASVTVRPPMTPIVAPAAKPVSASESAGVSGLASGVAPVVRPLTVKALPTLAQPPARVVAQQAPSLSPQVVVRSSMAAPVQAAKLPATVASPTPLALPKLVVPLPHPVGVTEVARVLASQSERGRTLPEPVGVSQSIAPVSGGQRSAQGGLSATFNVTVQGGEGSGKQSARDIVAELEAQEDRVMRWLLRARERAGRGRLS